MALKSKLLTKFKTDVMREMLLTDNRIDLEKISLHSSDGSDVITSTDKKLSAKQAELTDGISRSSLALSKVSHRLNSKDSNDHYRSNVHKLRMKRAGKESSPSQSEQSRAGATDD